MGYCEIDSRATDRLSDWCRLSPRRTTPHPGVDTFRAPQEGMGAYRGPIDPIHQISFTRLVLTFFSLHLVILNEAINRNDDHLATRPGQYQ